MSLYYLILWNQVDILQKRFKQDHVRMRLWMSFYGTKFHCCAAQLLLSQPMNFSAVPRSCSSSCSSSSSSSSNSSSDKKSVVEVAVVAYCSISPTRPQFLFFLFKVVVVVSAERPLGPGLVVVVMVKKKKVMIARSPIHK